MFSNQRESIDTFSTCRHDSDYIVQKTIKERTCYQFYSLYFSTQPTMNAPEKVEDNRRVKKIITNTEFTGARPAT